ncbi:50S ribosomal protein L30 [bacterium]|nr:50S ribosomal protein L30 [bacterium]
MAVQEEKSKKRTPKISKEKKKSSSTQLNIKLVRSLVGRPRKHREVVKGLGLKKLNSEVTLEDCPEVRGMINKVRYLIKVEAMKKK